MKAQRCFLARHHTIEILGKVTVADGVPEVLGAVRNELKKGASQIKIDRRTALVAASFLGLLSAMLRLLISVTVK